MAGYGIAIPIGPIAILILELGLRRGFWVAFSAGTGAASADLIYATIAAAVCPGHIRTDMGGPSAPRSVEEGADTAVWLATLPDDGPTGGVFLDRKRTDW